MIDINLVWERIFRLKFESNIVYNLVGIPTNFNGVPLRAMSQRNGKKGILL